MQRSAGTGFRLCLILCSVLALSACAALSPSGAGRGGANSVYGDFLVAQHAGLTRDAATAAARYQAVANADAEGSSFIERAFIYTISAGDVRGAAAMAPIVRQINPQSGLAPLVQGIAALRADRAGEALAFFRESYPGGQRDTLGRLLEVWAAAGAGLSTEARAMLTAEVPPGGAIFMRYHEALLAAYLGDDAAAAEAFTGLERDTGGRSLTVALAAARFHAAAGRANEALAAIERFRKDQPVNAVALEIVQKLNDGAPIGALPRNGAEGAAEALYGIASAMGGEDSIDAALVYLQLALFLDPGNDAAAAYLGGAYETADRPAEAIIAYNNVPESSVYGTTARVSAAEVMQTSGREDEALALLRSLERRSPRSVLASSALGDALRQTKDWDGAAEAYQRAIDKAGPAPFAAERWTLFYALGIAHERAGRWPEAEAAFKQALALSPGQAFVLNYLAYTWIEMGTNLDEALTLLEQAVAQRPEDGSIVDSLGWAHYRLGNYAKAVPILEQAVALSPYESVINEHLGDAYWKIGRQREARFKWTHALALSPEPEREPILRAKLAGGLETGERLEPKAAAAP